MAKTKPEESAFKTVVTLEIELTHNDAPKNAVRRFCGMWNVLYGISVIKAESNYSATGVPLKTWRKLNVDDME